MVEFNSHVYEILSDVLTDVSKHRDQQRDIEDYLVEHHKMIRGTFIELVTQPEKLVQLHEDVIPVFVNAIYEITKDERLFLPDLFSQKSIKNLKSFKFEELEQIKLPYTISSVIRVTSEDFLTAMSYKDLANLWNHKILTYNFQTQRLSKKKINSKGAIVEKADIKTKSVKSIKKLMLEGKYNPSTLLLNVLVDGKSSISFEDGELTIQEGSSVNIIDGMHRLMAIVEIIEENPDFEGYMNIDIKHYPIEKAQKLLAITNTVNRFDKTLVKYYGSEEYGQEIAKYLMTLPVLKNRIEIKTALSKGITITNFAILSEGIQSIFNPETTKDKYDIQDVLKRFYEYLVPSYEEVLVKGRTKNLEISWLGHHNMHVGFIVIAKKLYDKYGKEFPVDKIVEVIDGIDFDKQTSALTEIMGGQGKTNSNKVKQQIKDYISDEVERILK
ncbi:DNA sulfur modification protein DndB [Paenibacillus sp. TH7-28]